MLKQSKLLLFRACRVNEQFIPSTQTNSFICVTYSTWLSQNPIRWQALTIITTALQEQPLLSLGVLFAYIGKPEPSVVNHSVCDEHGVWKKKVHNIICSSNQFTFRYFWMNNRRAGFCFALLSRLPLVGKNITSQKWRRRAPKLMIGCFVLCFEI